MIYSLINTYPIFYLFFRISYLTNTSQIYDKCMYKNNVFCIFYLSRRFQRGFVFTGERQSETILINLVQQTKYQTNKNEYT